MPPWLTDPESVAAFIAALLGLLTTIGVGVLGSAAAVFVAWRSKIKPLLSGTQTAAKHAAEQLTPNHGSSARDSLGRIEATLDRVDRSLNRQIGEVRADMRTHIDTNDRQHSELFRRVNHIESPMEDTRP